MHVYIRVLSRNMSKTALSRMQRVHTVGTTISVTISMWLINGSGRKHTQASVKTNTGFSGHQCKRYTCATKHSTVPKIPNNTSLYLNFIMHWPNLWHICMFLIFLRFSSSWKGKQKKSPVRN